MKLYIMGLIALLGIVNASNLCAMQMLRNTKQTLQSLCTSIQNQVTRLKSPAVKAVNQLARLKSSPAVKAVKLGAGLSLGAISSLSGVLGAAMFIGSFAYAGPTPGISRIAFFSVSSMFGLVGLTEGYCSYRLIRSALKRNKPVVATGLSDQQG